MNIPITFLSDEKGYFDRECPNENCLFTYKISMEDWKEKVSDDEVHCPMCGHIDRSDKWWTQKQLADMKQIATDWVMSYAQGEINKSFKKLEHSSHGNKFLKVTYKPGRKTTFINNPFGQSDEWEQDIQCPSCQIRYSVVGSAFFCPCCGFNVIENVFDESLDTIVKMVNSLDKMENMFEQSYGIDKAVTICRSMLEDCLCNIVSAFQKFAERKYQIITFKNARINGFQIIEKGSKLFKDATHKGYDEWLSAEEILSMNLMFQRCIIKSFCC